MYLILLILLVCLNAVGAAWFGVQSIDMTGNQRRGMLVYASAFVLNMAAFLVLYAHLTAVPK